MRNTVVIALEERNGRRYLAPQESEFQKNFEIRQTVDKPQKFFLGVVNSLKRRIL